MGEICPKTKSYPSAHLAKINFNSPSHNDNTKANPPPPPSLEKKSPPIDFLLPSLLVGFLPPVQTSLHMTLHWTLSLCRLRMNWEIPHLQQHLWH